MTPFSISLQPIQLPTSAEIASAQKALTKEGSVDRGEETADFEETLGQVSSQEEKAGKTSAEKNQADGGQTQGASANDSVDRKEKNERKRAEGEKSDEESETVAAEKNHRETRVDERKKARRESEDSSPLFVAVPEGTEALPPELDKLALIFGVAPVMGGDLPGRSMAGPMSELVGPTTNPEKKVEEALQWVRSRTPQTTSGQRSSEAGEIPLALRSAGTRSGQPLPQISRAPLSAQSPNFSQELAERVGTLRLISRAGVSDQVRINLVPRDLGNLDIRLQVDSDSRVHMLVTAESETTKDLLKSQISHLRDSLIKQGMEFGDVDIQVDVRQREESGGTQADREWGGDSRFDTDQASAMRHEEIGTPEDSPVMGKVIRSADGGMSVFI